MTICPIAIAVGCEKCPAFRVCPLKSVLGSVPKMPPPPPPVEPAPRVRKRR